MIGCAFAGMGMIGDGSGWRPDSSCRSVGRAGARPSQGPSARTTVSTKLASGIVEHQLDSFSLQVTPPPPGFIAAGVVTGVTVGRAGARPGRDRPSQGPSARTTVSTKLASGIVEHQLDSFPCNSLRHRRVSSRPAQCQALPLVEAERDAPSHSITPSAATSPLAKHAVSR